MQVKHKRLRAGGSATRLGLGLTQAASVRIPALLRKTRRLGAIPTPHLVLADLTKDPSEEALRAASASTRPPAHRRTGNKSRQGPAPLLPPLPTLPSRQRERISISATTSTIATNKAPPRYLPPGFSLAAYTVLRRRNEGGTCEIYHVQHPKLSLRAIARVARRTVLEAHPWIRERMLSNAEIISESDHSNLMRILDLGETDETPPRPFVITERIVGRDLAAYLASHGRVPVATVLDIGLQITRGLAELHRLGLSHGDLKPSNIMISLRTDGSLRIVLIDFDLARHQEAPRSPGLSPGTPNYLPPEHSIGIRPSIYFDIYALGVILHELLLGECPVDEQRCLAAIEDQSEWPMICPLHIEHPELGIPRPLSRLIARLTHRDRCRRPKSLVEIERSIERLLAPETPHGPRNTAARTLRPSVSAWVNLALATTPRRPRPLAPRTGQIREDAAALAATVQPGRSPDLPRAILPLIVDEPKRTAPASSWHHGELLDQPTPDERASSPRRALRRGRLATMLALGAIVSVLSIIAGTARVIAMSDDQAESQPPERLNEAITTAPPVHQQDPLAHSERDEDGDGYGDSDGHGGDSVIPAGSLLSDTRKDDDPTTPESADARLPEPLRDRIPRRRSQSSAKTEAATARARTSPPRPSRSASIAPIIRPQDLKDESVAHGHTSAERASEANIRPTPRPAPPRETPPVIVPKLTGMDLDDATVSLRRVGINYRSRQLAASECFFREGTIIAQSFAPGTAIARNLEITIDYCRDEEDERE